MERTEFVPSLHAFRAFAIINIVAIHAFYFARTVEEASKPNLTPYDWGQSILFHDSTLYFAFISAILFSLVLAERGYVRFFRSKMVNVFSPYLFFTCVMTIFHFSPKGVFTVFDQTVFDLATTIGKNLLTGGAIFTFWYIPVLLVLYLATPVLFTLMAVNKAKYLVVLIILAPLVCSRAWPDFTWTNFVYFLGAYMLGLVVGAHFRASVDMVQKCLWPFILVALLSSAALVGLFYLDEPSWGIVNFSESAWYVQKIALAGLVILFFERTISTVPRWLDVLGRYGFSIYFLHGFLLFVMYHIMSRLISPPTSVFVILSLAILNTVLVIALSVVITYLFKLILGKYSRNVVGA